jgi:hypothetical protein
MRGSHEFFFFFLEVNGSDNLGNQKLKKIKPQVGKVSSLKPQVDKV